MLLAIPPANNDESMPISNYHSTSSEAMEPKADCNIWMRALKNPHLFLTVQQEPSANINSDEVDTPVNNNEALPISNDHPTSSEAVELRTGQQTQTLHDLLELIKSSDLTTIRSSEQSATAGANELDCPVNYDVAMPSG